MKLLSTLFLVVLLYMVTPATLVAQNLNSNWKQDLNVSLQQFLECKTNPNSACAGAAGKAIQTVYRINDFYIQQSGRYMTVTEILKALKENSNWTALGKSYDQKTLETAQDYANAKKAVIAVYQNADGIGHLVVITPGQLQPSGSWGLNVPNVASFLAVDPQKSFTDKALSFAFAKNMIKDVTIYARNY
jgi:hypothetical protein